MATLVHCTLQCLGGALLWWWRPLLLRLRPLSTWKLSHATSGLLLFVVATGALVTGMFSNWFVSMVEGTSWYACVSCPLLLLLVVANQLKNSYITKPSTATTTTAATAAATAAATVAATAAATAAGDAKAAVESQGNSKSIHKNKKKNNKKHIT